MDIEQKEQLAQTGDVSPEAIRSRLLAARKSIGMQQLEVAKELGLKKAYAGTTAGQMLTGFM